MDEPRSDSAAPAGTEVFAQRKYWQVTSFISILMLIACGGLFLRSLVIKERKLGDYKLTQRRLQLFQNAIYEYQNLHQHSSYPYDQRGGDYAAYQLRDFLGEPDASFSNGEGIWKWDQHLHRLDLDRFLYLNPDSGVDVDYRQIIAVSLPAHGRNAILGITRGGNVCAIEGSDREAAEALLGAYLPRGDDDILFSTKNLLDTWDQHANDSSQSDPPLTDDDLDPILVSKLAVGTDHLFNREKRILYREFHFPNGTIKDTFRFDQYGIVTGVERTPENWKEIWRECQLSK